MIRSRLLIMAWQNDGCSFIEEIRFAFASVTVALAKSHPNAFAHMLASKQASKRTPLKRHEETEK